MNDFVYLLFGTYLEEVDGELSTTKEVLNIFNKEEDAHEWAGKVKVENPLIEKWSVK